MALRELNIGTDALKPAIAPILAKTAAKGKKTVEQTYQKLTQLEHILLRPDTYIGSVERATQHMHVWDSAAANMVARDVTFAPGLYKIFDEILVNAADHKQRCQAMKTIRVEIDAEANKISVWNDGSGIPVEMHAKEGVYVPELIFGHLLTSSNYDDGEKKVVGGRNGYGAKLANIFSKEFTVETADSERGKKYTQVFRNNMNSKDKPSITSNPRNENWTRITFSPDLAKFGMLSLDNDVVALMTKRVYDIAGTNPAIRVFLNGDRLPVKSFKDYISFYHATPPDVAFMHERCGARWEIAVGASGGQLEQISFVNSIWTIKGGTHVAHVVDQVVAKIAEQISKKNKGMKLKPHQIKSHLSVFVNCQIENPAFDSQTKETLTTKSSQFGSKCVLTDEIVKKILKSGIVENVLSFAKFKQGKELAKTDGGKKVRVLGVPKLDDANKAGGRDASKCTLILTEGDSAKALAVSGLSIIGRDYYGVFPLRGKLLNVREASHKQIMDNAEISNLKKILGLQQNKVYNSSNINTLRYGHVLIMTDQDHDGSHIKGLLINFFDHFWPALLSVDGFLQEFITPIVKCTKGKAEKVFFTMPEYQQWIDMEDGGGALWKIKYYKGLGTSTAAEAKTYFSDLGKHLIPFQWCGPDDSKMIELAFAKAKVSERKQWLTDYVPGTYFDHAVDELNYTNFINKELILFSIADNARSIPSVVDGLKPSQRKVLFACFKRKLTKNEIKVVQLAGYVSEHAAYHHGEASLQATILGLAQNFVGSNNANLLVPAGQFGTRLQGGKDAASSRYIFTKLAPVARALFPEADDAMLAYQEDDGVSVEPNWYCPIIPTILLNGADGIGTGWSTAVPCYNPKDLIASMRQMIKGGSPPMLTPWYRGFTGTIVNVGNSPSYDVHGVVVRGESDDVIKVKELPIRSWTTPYKDFIEAQVAGVADNKDPFVKEFSDNSTENKVSFTITLTPDAASSISGAGDVHKRLKLSGAVSTGNMMLFDAEGRIAKYEDTKSIMAEFFGVRLDMYKRRRGYILNELQEELDCLDNKQRFILMAVEGTIKVSNRPKAVILADLVKHKFKAIPKRTKRATSNKSAMHAHEEESDGDESNGKKGEEATSATEKGYDYLLSMPIWSLTKERVDKLCAQRDFKAAEKAEMEATNVADLWLRDLDDLESVMEADRKFAASEAADLNKAANVAKRNQQKAGRGAVGRSKAAAISYAGLDGDDDDEVNTIAPPTARVKAAVKHRQPKATTAPAAKISGLSRTKASVKPDKLRKGVRIDSVELDEYDSEDEEENEFISESDDDLDDKEEDLKDSEDDVVFDDGKDTNENNVDVNGSADSISLVENSPPHNSRGRATAAAAAKKKLAAAVAPATAVAGGRGKGKASGHASVVEDERVANGSDKSDSDSDSDDDGNMSLAQRLAVKKNILPSVSLVTCAKQVGGAGAAPAASSKRPRVSKAAAVKSTVLVESAERSVFSPSPAPKKKRVRIVSPIGGSRKPVKRSVLAAASKSKGKVAPSVKKAAIVGSDDGDDDDLNRDGSDLEDEVNAPVYVPVKKAAAPAAARKPAAGRAAGRKPAARRAPTKKPAAAVVVDSDKDEDDGGGDGMGATPVKPSARPARRVAAKKVPVVVDSDSDEDGDGGMFGGDSSEFEEDDCDDSDF
jgi:DNA topoisomerase II